MREDLDAPARLSATETKGPQPCDTASLQKLAYSVREVAALTGLGRSTIYVLLGQKKLASLRVGGRRLIPHAAVIALLGGK